MISKSYTFNVLLVIIYISTLGIIFWYDDYVLDKEKRPTLYPLPRDIGQKRQDTEDSNVDMSDIRREKGIMLAWRHPGGNVREGYGPGTYGNCSLTYNRSLFNDAILVLFDFSAFDEKVGLDGHVRSPDQIFVWNTMESAATLRHAHHRSFKQFDGMMNWTMTYRRDSDILSSYADPNLVRGLLENHSGKENIDKLLETKHNIALWVVSNCGGTGGAVRRMNYVNEMVAAGLQVQRYGGCFNNRAQFDAMPAEEKNSFKFYLAFENTYRCRDYITEKFWYNGIANQRVPVVWGPRKSDVVDLAPPGSFIHADDFESPAKLAEYLNYLDKNTTAYREYFHWLEYPEPSKIWFDSIYKDLRLDGLCKKAKSYKGQQKVIPSIDDFFYGAESQECLG